MELGILGGSFNPIHLGHLVLAQECREELGLDRVLLVPAREPPHKDATRLLDAGLRYQMVADAVADNPALVAEDIELARAGASYTVDTLEALREKYPDAARLWFIVGSDSFREMQTWHEARRIFALADVAVASRPPHRRPAEPPAFLAGDYVPGPRGLEGPDGREVRFLRATFLDISSTRIRQKLDAGHSIRYLVPEMARHRLETTWQTLSPP